MSQRRISNIGLFVDARRRSAAEAAQSIAALAADARVTLQVKPDQAAVLGLSSVATSEDFPRGADLLVSLGGDGTLLRAAHYAVPLGIAIVGVDFGRMGFLTSVDRGDFKTVLAGLLRDGFETEPRTTLEAAVNGKRFLAINDIHIDRKQHGHTVVFGIDIAGEHVADIPADGIVVSSPTGSTAYFLSAGGPIMAPGLDAFGIAPICPHTLFSRPLIVSATETIRIEVPSGGGGAHLFADGRQVIDVPPGSAVQIARASHPAEFVKLDNRQFFQLLESKLHWGTSIKTSLHGEDGRVERRPR
jgi:NAD+ kinase